MLFFFLSYLVLPLCKDSVLLTCHTVRLCTLPFLSGIPISRFQLHRSWAHFRFCLYQNVFLDFPTALGFASLWEEKEILCFSAHPFMSVEMFPWKWIW